jgi:hypothetical protein
MISCDFGLCTLSISTHGDSSRFGAKHCSPVKCFEAERKAIVHILSCSAFAPVRRPGQRLTVIFPSSMPKHGRVGTGLIRRNSDPLARFHAFASRTVNCSTNGTGCCKSCDSEVRVSTKSSSAFRLPTCIRCFVSSRDPWQSGNVANSRLPPSRSLERP